MTKIKFLYSLLCTSYNDDSIIIGNYVSNTKISVKIKKKTDGFQLLNSVFIINIFNKFKNNTMYVIYNS